MRRREFITLLDGTALAWPLDARAQQPERMRRIGTLIPFSENDSEGQRRITAFRKRLLELGWVVEQNARIEDRWVGNDPERIKAVVRDLIELKPDVILTVSALILAPLRAQTSTIPIVFTNIVDPVNSGFVASLAHPGGNITGFSSAEFSIWGKSLEILKEVAPSITRIAVIYNPEQSPQLGMLRNIETLAPSFSLDVVSMQVRQQVEQAIGAFAQEGSGGGLVVLPNPVADSIRDVIIGAARQHKLPAIYAFRYFVVDGGLMSYGIDTAEQFKQAASYVDQILRGAKPADLPIQQPTKFELVVNLKTAKALGLKIPESFLLRADEVIE
jgi:putative tryptophan/tyrosine transport system substrate-binding protein